MSFKSLCIEYFGSNNFYEILGVNSDASTKEIKKAYHKMSLLVHPDRVDAEQKTIATEKFKVLGKIHSILQDDDKRKLYDDVDEFDDEMDSSFNWFDYWRNMFKKIDLEDIKKYEEEYIGSETELRDIKKAYISSKGNMNKFLEMVPFGNCDREPRYIEIVTKLVEDGEVERFDAFFNESKQKKMRRRRKWENEKKEAEKIDSKFILIKYVSLLIFFLVEQLEKEVEENMKRRAKQFENLVAEIESKYAPKKKTKLSITDGSKQKRTRKSKK